MAYSLVFPHQEALEGLWRPWGKRRVPRGATLLDPAGPTPNLCLILRGLSKLYVLPPDGTLRIVRFTRPFDILGLPSALVGRTPRYFAATVTESEVAFLPRDEALRRIQGDPELSRAVLSLLVDTIAQLCEREALPRQKGCDGQIASALWHLLHRSGMEDAPPPVALGLTHQELADFLGLHRVSVTRAVGRLAERGVLRCRPRALEILRPLELEAFAVG